MAQNNNTYYNDPTVHIEKVFGTIGTCNPPVMVPYAERRLQFQSPDGDVFSISNDMLEKHLLCIGGPGSGKTNVLDLILEQLRYMPNTNDFFVIFDTKGDYIKEFYREGDYVIANGDKYRKYSGFVHWNIFEELKAAGKDWMIAAREISKSLFADRANKTQPFFSNAAEDIFSGLLIHFYRSYQGDPTKLNNRYLINTIRKKDTKWYLDEVLNEEVNPDLVGMRSYIGDGKSNQALGVLGELKSMIYGCFVDTFEQAGSFSIRNAVRSRGARAVFIEYDMSVGKSMTPLCRLLVDLALKETMGRSAQSTGRVWYILDELKLLPNCLHLEDGLNLGRSLGCSVIAGLQSVNQMYEIYEKFGGQVILGGFSNVLAFSTTDFESRDYITKLFGVNVTNYWLESPMTVQISPRERDGHVVEEWDLQKLGTGEAFVSLLGHPPFKFHFPRYTHDSVETKR